MKKNIILIILCLVFCISCSNKKVLVGKTYLYETFYKKQSFIFLDKNICLYKQYFTFDCDSVDYQYKNYEMICKYKMSKNRIEMQPIYPLIDSLVESGYIRIPDSEIIKCEFLRNRLDSKQRFNNSYYIGYFNYINSKDTIYYLGNIIIDSKAIQIRDKKTGEIELGGGLIDAYILEGCEIDSLEAKQRVTNFFLKKYGNIR